MNRLPHTPTLSVIGWYNSKFLELITRWHGCRDLDEEDRAFLKQMREQMPQLWAQRRHEVVVALYGEQPLVIPERSKRSARREL